MGFFKRKKSTTPGKVLKKFCPVCFSENIRESNPFGGVINQIQYTCSDCGYSGTVILEVEVDPKEICSSGEEDSTT
ncbi:MAG: PaaD-like zinc ribbon domain-containing protein [Candidatus Odinarchaeia archaeon]